MQMSVTCMSAFWHFIECTGKALIQVLSLTDHGQEAAGGLNCGSTLLISHRCVHAAVLYHLANKEKKHPA